MYIRLTSEKALFIDKLIKTTKSEYIVFEIDTILQIVLISPDISQMTVVKFEPEFFEEFKCEKRMVVSTQMKKFHVPNMKELRIELFENQICFEHRFTDVTTKKTYLYLHPDIFDIDFHHKFSLELDLPGLKRVISGLKDKEIKVKIGESITFSSATTTISIPGTDFEAEFEIDSEKFKNVIGVSDLFYEHKLNIPEEFSPVNFVYRLPDVLFTTFISTE